MALNTCRMKILCRTLFDCSCTGVTGHYRSSEIPFVDRSGQSVTDQATWTRSRNQQRNYETLLQIFGLRTQPQEISVPVRDNGSWSFSFESESEGVFQMHNNTDELAGLKLDCDGVPMMLSLQEGNGIDPMLCTNGSSQNIWFSSTEPGATFGSGA